jgi:hypothetical protein
MIQIIAGEKGKGKTKILIEKANTSIREAKGSIVYLDKSNKHMYELSNKIRLINVRDYCIENYCEFIGFICGLISSDHDLEAIYLDSFLKIANSNGPDVALALEKLETISNLFNIKIVISISLNESSLPEAVKNNVIVSL